MDLQGNTNVVDAPSQRLPARAATMDYAPVSSGRWQEAVGANGAVKLALIAALFIWLYWAEMVRFYWYWQEPDWSHGFLVPIFCLYFIHSRRGEYLSGEHRGSWLGIPVMLVAFVGYVYCIRAQIMYPQSLSMLIMLAGLVLALRGWRSLWLALFPIGFLLLAIPPPQYIYRAITQPLQQWMASISTFVLNTLPGTEVENNGINIAYYHRGGHFGEFTVAGACSGMRSLLAFVFLGMAMAYLSPRPTWHRIAMALLVVPVAVFCNCIRVLVTGSLHIFQFGEFAEGTPHSLLGFLMFGVGIAIFLGLLWVMDHLFVEESDSRTETAE